MSEQNPYEQNPYSPQQFQQPQPSPQPQYVQPQYVQPPYQPPHYQQYPPPYYQHPYPYVVTGRPVNKVAYVLLALFLGGLGAHHFYANRIGLGIVYLLFSWTFIPAFISLIEGIIAAFKTSDPYGTIFV